MVVDHREPHRHVFQHQRLHIDGHDPVESLQLGDRDLGDLEAE